MKFTLALVLVLALVPFASLGAAAASAATPRTRTRTRSTKALLPLKRRASDQTRVLQVATLQEARAAVQAWPMVLAFDSGVVVTKLQEQPFTNVQDTLKRLNSKPLCSSRHPSRFEALVANVNSPSRACEVCDRNECKSAKGCAWSAKLRVCTLMKQTRMRD